MHGLRCFLQVLPGDVHERMGSYGEDSSYNNKINNFGRFKLVTNLEETKEAKCNYGKLGSAALNYGKNAAVVPVQYGKTKAQARPLRFWIWSFFVKITRLVSFRKGQKDCEDHAVWST